MAPISPRSVEILTTRPKWKANVRLMKVGDLAESPGGWVFRCIEGGMLMQEADVLADPEDDWKVVTDAKPAEAQFADLRFAWNIVRHVKSNAIAICKDRMLLGGIGHRAASIRWKSPSTRPTTASRARPLVRRVFPFPDSIEPLAKAGIAAVIQPGGSKNDQAVISACNASNVPMIFTGAPLQALTSPGTPGSATGSPLSVLRFPKSAFRSPAALVAIRLKRVALP